MEKPIIIFGAKRLVRPALEIFKSNGILVYGILDDDEQLHHTEIFEIPILGATDDHEFLKLIGQKCDVFLATDSNEERKELSKYLNKNRKVMPVNAVHQSAIISEYATIGHGNFINACVFLGSGVRIGNHNLIHTQVSIDTETKIGDYVQLGAGSVINSDVEIEDQVFIGSGVTVIPGIKIHKKARIGAGSVVVGNVEAGQTIFGNPATPVDKLGNFVNPE